MQDIRHFLLALPLSDQNKTGETRENMNFGNKKQTSKQQWEIDLRITQCMFWQMVERSSTVCNAEKTFWSTLRHSYVSWQFSKCFYLVITQRAILKEVKFRSYYQRPTMSVSSTNITMKFVSDQDTQYPLHVLACTFPFQ